MNLDFLTNRLSEANFQQIRPITSLPVVVHGVPGCGKSTVIKAILPTPDLTAFTLGSPYGDTLATAGVKPHNPSQLPRTRHRVLDEYQLGDAETAAAYTILFGDPYQGHYRRDPHFIKEISHRVPRPICDWLGSLGFQISSTRPGVHQTANPFKLPKGHPAVQAKIFHLGPASAALAESHHLRTACPREAQGEAHERVTILAHSSELRNNRVGLYVAATRTTRELIVLSDAFNELCTST